MGITPHTIVGSLIAVGWLRIFRKKEIPFTKSFVFVAILAFCSHFLLDAIPHGEYWSTDRGNLKGLLFRVLIDGMIAITIIAFSSHAWKNGFIGLWQRRLLLVGSFFSILPDIVNTSVRYFKFTNGTLFWFTKNIHDPLHSSSHPSFSDGLPAQAAIIVVSAALVWQWSKDN